MDAMKRYAWPGNVRELKNMLERAMTFNDTGVIQFSELEFGETVDSGSIAPAPAASPRPFPGGGASLDSMEREHIIKVLKETCGNKMKTAVVSGIERTKSLNNQKTR